nr:hypothetical protein TorRG33x02_197190 [Ipomoea trifida]
MLKLSVALASSSYENSTDLSTVIPVGLGEVASIRPEIEVFILTRAKRISYEQPIILGHTTIPTRTIHSYIYYTPDREVPGTVSINPRQHISRSEVRVNKLSDSIVSVAGPDPVIEPVPHESPIDAGAGEGDIDSAAEFRHKDNPRPGSKIRPGVKPPQQLRRNAAFLRHRRQVLAAANRVRQEQPIILGNAPIPAGAIHGDIDGNPIRNVVRAKPVDPIQPILIRQVSKRRRRDLAIRVAGDGLVLKRVPQEISVYAVAGERHVYPDVAANAIRVMNPRIVLNNFWDFSTENVADIGQITARPDIVRG